MMPAFEYQNQGNYGDVPFSNKWMVNETNDGLVGTSIYSVSEFARQNTNNDIDFNKVKRILSQLDEMDEDPENLFIQAEQSSDLTASYNFDLEESDFTAQDQEEEYNKAVIINSKNRNVDRLGKKSNLTGRIDVYSTQSMKRDGWTLSAESGEKGNWTYVFEGTNPRSPYDQILGEPEKYFFKLPKGLEIKESELPIESLRMLSNISKYSDQKSPEEVPDFFKNIIDDVYETFGAEWVSVDNKNSFDGVINEIAGKQRVVEVEGSLILEKHEEGWRKALDRAGFSKSEQTGSVIKND